MLLTNTAQENVASILLLTLHTATNCHCTATTSEFCNHAAALREHCSTLREDHSALRCLSVHCTVAAHLLLLLLISAAAAHL